MVKKDISNININEVKELLKSHKIDELMDSVKKAKQSVDGIIKTIGEKEQALKARAMVEERERAESAQTDYAVNATQNDSVKGQEAVAPVADDAPKSKIEKADKAEKTEKAEKPAKSAKLAPQKADEIADKAEKTEKTEKIEKAEKTETAKESADSHVKSDKKSNDEVIESKEKSEKADKTEKVEKTETAKPAKTEKTETAEKVEKPAKAEAASESDGASTRKDGAKADAAKPLHPTERPQYHPPVRPQYHPPERPQYVPRQAQNGERREYTPGQRPQYNQGERREYTPGQRPNNGQGRPYNQNGPRPYGQNNGQGRPPYGQNGGQRPFGQNNGQGGQRPFNSRPSAPKPEISFIPKEPSKFATANKKKTSDRNYDDKHTVSKKQLSKVLTVEDFDENKTGYRKLRKKNAFKTKEEQRIKIEHAIINKEIIPLKELSEKIGISAVEITKMLFKEGIIKTINDSIDYDTAGFVAANLGIELELKLDKTAEDVLTEGFNDESDNEEDYVTRPPVVTVMGHVDHGKTSLLDRIRSTNVTGGEAGGITQHIGAYSVNVRGNKITFLDTPGHAAFTAMRARGAQVTDIAVIVIAADDGIMPQTIEAINHAKAAKVSIIVAANKIDKPHANIDRVRQQLTEQGVVVEDYGGDVILVPVSAKTGEGVDNLLDSILLIAEMRELKANPNRKAKGAVVEAKLDKGKGPVATIIVQNGTLRLGDNIVAGTIVGKVRAMFDDKGRMVKEAGPSMAVSVLGLESVPNAGDIIFAVDQEKLTKLVAEERKNKEREEMIRQQQKVSLDELFSKISVGDLKVLNLIIKADVQGSVEAVKQSLEELSNESVKVCVIHSGVGAINETDVMLADSSNSIIIGFNVRPDANAKTLAERAKVDVKLYRIIYEAIDDVTKAMKGMLAPKFNDVYMGKAEVRETFKITGVGVIAGSYVTEGKIVRNGKLRIYREDVMICEGNVLQLKRFKDDVKEVNQGFECGISIENFNDIKVGDFIECYIVEEQKQ